MKNIVNLFIVGAAKCGTTSLYEYLVQHPEIFMASVKEPHFFSAYVENPNRELYTAPEKGKKYHTKIIRDSQVYASLFDEAGRYKIRGEASPSYLWSPDSAKRIFEYNSDAKILVVLRDPVKRLISNYQMDFSMGIQNNTSFLETIKNEFNKKKKIWGMDRIYIDLGFYYEQISRYFSFFSADQILILRFDDLMDNSTETLRRVFEFLEVNTLCAEQIDFRRRHNTATHPKYQFVQKLRKKKFIKKFTGILGEKKELLKKMVFSSGYNNKITIDTEAENYLREIYKDDLAMLKKYYQIEL